MRRATLLTLFLLLIPVLALAQSPAVTAARAYLDQHRGTLGLTAADLDEIVVTDAYTTAHNGVTHVYFLQRHQGIGVHHGLANVNLAADLRVLSVGNRFVTDLAGRANSTAPGLSQESAVAAAASSVGLVITEPLTTVEVLGGPDDAVRLSGGGIAREPISARLVYQAMDDGAARLAWHVEVYQNGAQHYWSVLVDALNGAVLETDDLVVSDRWGPDVGYATDSAPLPYTRTEPSPRRTNDAAPASVDGGQYRVFNRPVESPIHAPVPGDRGPLTLTPAAAPYSPLGWHNDGTASFTITRGNNVYAYEDQTGTESGLSPDGGPGLVFDFPLDLNQEPSAYVDAAVTNLFFWNNLMHDITFQYGFDEAGGNPQQTNFSGQGAGGDAVRAEAQDGGGTNNANMLTLQDGVPPRMQMFLWTPPSLVPPVFINAPANLAGEKASLAAAFGPRPMNETADVVEAVANVNAVGDPEEGCGLGQDAPAPLLYQNAAAVNGKIALVRRGNCSFIEKVLSAQQSGAIGVIVYNNDPGAGPIVMGATAGGELALIPSAMIPNADGLDMLAELDAAVTVNATLRQDTVSPPLRDGDFDNGVIAHEYGHTVSIRLTGGPSTQCLVNDEQQGEGWSDFLGYMVTMKPGDTGSQGRGIGTYPTYQPPNGPGIRPATYDTDLADNGYTYGSTVTGGQPGGLSVPHGIGFVWASMLWEMTWALIDDYGFDPDLYNASGGAGNQIALQLVMDGLKLQPCEPGFVDSRDAILLADRINNGGANQERIWRAFAKRGLGWSARQGSHEDLTDNVEAFDIPPEFRLNVVKAATPNPASNNNTLTYTLTVTNNTGSTVTGVTLDDVLDDDVQFLSASDGGAYDGGSNTVTFPPIPSLASGASVVRTIEVRVLKPGASILTFEDDTESGGGQWATGAEIPASGLWATNTDSPHSGATAWLATPFAETSTQELTLAAPVTLLPNTMLQFFHWFVLRDRYHGGIVQLSNDGGTTWTDLGSRMTMNGYTSNPFADVGSPYPFTQNMFTGESQGGYVETRVNLSDFAGDDVLIRFQLGSAAQGGTGGWWYLDDIRLVGNFTEAVNTATVASNEDGPHSETFSVIVLDSATQAPVLDLRYVAEPSPVLDGNLLTYTFTLTNNKAIPVTGIALAGEIPALTHFDAATDGGTPTGSTVDFPPFSLGVGQSTQRSFTVRVDAGQGSDLFFSDDMEHGPGGWTTTNASDVGTNNWVLGTDNPHSGTNAWFTPDQLAASDQSLTMAAQVPVGPGVQLQFWHHYNTDERCHGGVVELSTDGGTVWEDLGSRITQNGYFAQNIFVDCSGTAVTWPDFFFTGNSGGYLQTIVDLADFAGENVLIRFRFHTTNSLAANPQLGWYIDDVDLVTNPVELFSLGSVTSNECPPDSRDTRVFVLGNPNPPPQDLHLVKTATPSPVHDQEILTYTLTITNGSAAALTNVAVEDELDADVIVIPGSISDGGTDGGTEVTWPPISTMAPGEVTTRTYQVRVNKGQGSTILLADDIEGGAGNWTTTNPSDPNVNNQWGIDAGNPHSGLASWHAPDLLGASDQYLVTLNPVALAAGSVLQFWHLYDTEYKYDCAQVEISISGSGGPWVDLGSRMTQNGYNDFAFVNVGSATVPLSECFTGFSGAYQQTVVDLDDFAGQSAHFRFRLNTAALNGAALGTGWFLDDVHVVVNPVTITTTATTTASEGNTDAFTTLTFVLPALPNLRVDTRVLLEGPYDAGTGRMLTTLNTNGDLPANQPYSNAAFDGTGLDYDGAESVAAGFFAAHPDVVDWVLVELRETADGPAAATRAALLLDDGAVVDLDGFSPVSFGETVPFQDYVVVLRHRNHLDVKSASAVTLTSAVLAHDFTTGQGQANGAEPMKDLGGVFALYAGDADANGQVQTSDKNLNWRNEVGQAGYKSADFNLDGQVQTSDKNGYWRPNVGKGAFVD